MNVLFIEDDPNAVADAMELLEQTNFKPSLLNFTEASDQLLSLKPDVIILDIFKTVEGSRPVSEGDNSFRQIWDKRFCPVVIYSSDPDGLQDIEDTKDHPFIKRVKKGRDSHKVVVSIVQSFANHVSALKETEAHFVQEMSLVFKKVAPNIFNSIEEDKRSDALLRACRRRLAASMDEYSNGNTKLANWEQYIFPVISKDLLLGDILFLNGRDTTKPENYFIILTPSCDLVNTPPRKHKVDNVLIAECCSIADGKKHSELLKAGKNKLKDGRLKNALTTGYFESFLPLPELTNLIPHMLANFKKLKLVPFNEIGDDLDKTYIRKASIDSPFRELVSWAYMQVAGRTGVPDRDFDAWVEQLMNQIPDTGAQ